MRAVGREEAAPTTAWGPVEDGLQTGFRLSGGRTVFRRGEVLSAQVVLRNVLKTSRQLDSWSPTAWSFEVADGKRILARAVSEEIGYTFTTVLVLPAGAEDVLPEAGPRALLRENGWKGDEQDFSIPTLRLAPGKYRISTPRPFRSHGSGIEQRKDLLPSGAIEITILPDPPQESREVAGYRIAWGKPENGLQAGLALYQPTRVNEPGDEVTWNLYLRNEAPKPQLIQFTRQNNLDYLPTVHAAAGERAEVNHIGISGYRGQEEQTLKPGERIILAHPQMKLRAQPDEAIGVVPSFLATVGVYRVSHSFFFKSPNAAKPLPRLETGEVALAVTALGANRL
jgi:hypothetical protein